MAERRLLFIDLLGDDEMPTQAQALVAFLQERLATVPEEWRSSVTFYQEAYDNKVDTSFGYEREETAQEASDRNDRECAARDAREAGQREQRRRQYEALRLEFEGPVRMPRRAP